MKIWKLSIPFLALLVMTACYIDDTLPRNNPYDVQFDKTYPCQSNADCAKVGYCQAGTCVQCRANADCRDSQICSAGKCEACTQTEQCSDGLACIEGSCQTCKTSLDCGGSLVCRSNKCSPCESESPGTCILSGTYTEDLQLTADTKWILRGAVFIGDDVKQVTLKIEPGTTIVGEGKTNGVLVVRRNAKLDAQGTAEKPIIFTSSNPKGSRKRGDWGGIVINGRARLNKCVQDSTKGCEGFGEGGTGWYGGTDDNDSSGTLKYVRVEFAGKLFSPDNELNGIAFQAVGSGTTIDYLQIHMAQDDGVEFFGGTANLSHVLITGAADDSLDWTDGWRGKGQFIAIQQYDDDGDNGIEADNNSSDNTASPRSKPTLSHITLAGSPQSEKSDLGMLLREGTAALIYNSIITGFNDACIMLDQVETYNNAFKDGKLTGELLLSHSIINCVKNFSEVTETVPFTVANFVTTLNEANKLVDPKLTAPYNLTKPDLRPGSGSPALSGAKQFTDAFFQNVSYVGAIDPEKDWTKGWTTSDPN